MWTDTPEEPHGLEGTKTQGTKRLRLGQPRPPLQRLHGHERYGKTFARQKTLFQELLDETDNDLLDWALGRGEPADPRYRSLIVLLRSGGCGEPAEDKIKL